MSTRRVPKQTLNMIAAWAGALMSLGILVSRPNGWMHQLNMLIAPLMAVSAAVGIATIVRFQWNRTVTVVLCGCLGAVFTAFSCSLTEFFGR